MNSRVTNIFKPLLDTLLSTGFFSIAGSSIINRLLSFMSGIIVVRLLSKADYGIYSYAYNLLNIALLFNGIGFSSAFIQLCCEPGGRKRENSLELLGFTGGMGFDLILSVCIFLIATFLPENMPGTRQLLQLCALFPIPQFLYDMQSSALRAQLRNSEYAKANVINTAFVVAGTLLGAVAHGAIGLLIGRATGILISTGVVFYRFGVPVLFTSQGRADLGRERSLGKNERLDYVKIAISSALANGISSFTYLIGTFMIGQLLHDPLEVASYEAASSIPVALNFIPVTVMTYVYPYFAHHKDDLLWVRKNYFRLLTLSFIGFGTVSLACALFAPQIISLVYGEQYFSSVLPFRILLIGSWIGATFRIVSGNLLVTQRLVTANLLSSILTVSTILFLNYILVPSMGSLGSAIAQTVGLCASGIFNTTAFALKISGKQLGGNAVIR